MIHVADIDTDTDCCLSPISTLTSFCSDEELEASGVSSLSLLPALGSSAWRLDSVSVVSWSDSRWRRRRRHSWHQFYLLLNFKFQAAVEPVTPELERATQPQQSRILFTGQRGKKIAIFLNRTTIYLESKWVTVIWFLITGPRFRIGWILRWRSNQNTAVGKSSFETKIVCVCIYLWVQRSLFKTTLVEIQLQKNSDGLPLLHTPSTLSLLLRYVRPPAQIIRSHKPSF